MMRTLALAAILFPTGAAHGASAIFIDNETAGEIRAKMKTKGYVKQGAMTERDYPIEALRNDQTGRVLVSFIISADQRASDCQVVSTSGVAVLDDRTCLIVNTRYVVEPPRDEEGNALLGKARQWVIWQLAD